MLIVGVLIILLMIMFIIIGGILADKYMRGDFDKKDGKWRGGRPPK